MEVFMSQLDLSIQVESGVWRMVLFYAKQLGVNIWRHFIDLYLCFNYHFDTDEYIFFEFFLLYWTLQSC